MRAHSTPRSSARRGFLAATIVGAVLLMGCGDDSTSSDSDSGAAPTAADLDGRTFLSSSVEGKTLVEGTRISLSFTADSVAAVAGCNTMTGGYTLDGSTLVIATMAQTMMACDEEIMAQDTWVAELLQGKPTVALDGNELSVKNDDITVTLDDRESVSDNALDGGSWALDSFDDAGTVMTAPESAYLAITDGQLYVATGCNRGFGEVTVNDDGTVEVGAIALTRMACESPVNEWEQALTMFLTGTLSYEVDGADVTVTNGTQTLTMHEIPWTP